jgi:metal-responsive CopG/Arc/MetJ family transcriptional regulator
MPSAKTAISMKASLLERIDRAAKTRNLTRSRLLADAAEKYLERLDSQEIQESWNEAYADGLDLEEEAALKIQEALHWEVLEDERW